MTLYDLTGEYLSLANMLTDPDVDDEHISTAMADINDQLEIKADNYAKILRNLENQVEGIKSEQKRLADRKAQIEKHIDYLKSNLQEAMIVTGKTKFETDLFTFRIQKNGGALPVILDADVAKLPDDLVTVVKKPDLKAIAQYIEETGDVTYAHFGERGESLRIK